MLKNTLHLYKTFNPLRLSFALFLTNTFKERQNYSHFAKEGTRPGKGKGLVPGWSRSRPPHPLASSLFAIQHCLDQLILWWLLPLKPLQIVFPCDFLKWKQIGYCLHIYVWASLSLVFPGYSECHFNEMTYTLFIARKTQYFYVVLKHSSSIRKCVFNERKQEIKHVQVHLWKLWSSIWQTCLFPPLILGRWHFAYSHPCLSCHEHAGLPLIYKSIRCPTWGKVSCQNKIPKCHRL